MRLTDVQIKEITERFERPDGVVPIGEVVELCNEIPRLLGHIKWLQGELKRRTEPQENGCLNHSV